MIRPAASLLADLCVKPWAVWTRTRLGCAALGFTTVGATLYVDGVYGPANLEVHRSAGCSPGFARLYSAGNGVPKYLTTSISTGKYGYFG